jgi:excisionase family DNA binding protein
LSILASAHYLSATTSFVRHLIAIGELPFTKAGQRFVIDRLDLDGWLETHKQFVTPKLPKTEAA